MGASAPVNEEDKAKDEEDDRAEELRKVGPMRTSPGLATRAAIDDGGVGTEEDEDEDDEDEDDEDDDEDDDVDDSF